jgi:hypothetical protein
MVGQVLVVFCRLCRLHVFGQIWTKFGKCMFYGLCRLCVWIVLDKYLINSGFGKVCVWTYLDECLVNSGFDKWCVWTDLDIACIYEGFLVNAGFVDYVD